MHRLPDAGLLLLRSRGCRHTSFSSSSSLALECRLGSCGAWGFGAPRCVRSPRIRNRNPVPCIGRRIPIHCTREFLEVIIDMRHVTLNIVPVTKAMQGWVKCCLCCVPALSYSPLLFFHTHQQLDHPNPFRHPCLCPPVSGHPVIPF